MKNNDDIAKDSTDYLERKAKISVKNKSYKVVHGSLNRLNEKRKIKIHKNHIKQIHSLDSEINNYYQNDKSQPTSSFERKINSTNHKINNVNTKKNNLLDRRHALINATPKLKSSLNTSETQHFHVSAVSSDKSSHVTKEYKISDKRLFKYKNKRSNATFKKNRYSKITINQKDNKLRMKNNKEKDLDNDGVPDRIDVDDTRNAVQTTSDLSEVGNKTSKRHKKLKIEGKNKSEYLFTNTKNNQRRKRHSPLTSESVGKRTKTQKVLLAPSKAVSSAGGSLKESLNKEIDNSDMEGIKLANSVVSPLTKKLKFQTTSLVSKKVGFDKQAYKLSKIESKVKKANSKAFKIKKAQRKMIRKKAVLNAKAVKGSKLDLVGRVKALSAKSFTQIKAKLLLQLKKLLAAISQMKVVAFLGSGFIVSILPLLILIPLLLLSGGTTLTSANEEQELSFSSSALSPEVMQWEEKVEDELNKYGLEKYKDLVLVLISLETGGTLPDVMQSSESLGLPPNTIDDPHQSIEAGVRHLNESVGLMNDYDVDIQTLIQSYNYGTGFISYVAQNGGSWTQKLADDFSNQEAERLGWSSYGDSTYVSKAMKHLVIEGEDIFLGGDFDLEGGKLAYPVPNYESAVSSSYGWRIHPIHGTRKFHTGTDIPAPTGTPVIAVADGTVIEAKRKGGYGNAVMIDHGSGVITLYAHNSSLNVEVGRTVKVGQMIAKVGSTGDSTGAHSHFEVRVNGEFTDPVKWFK